MKDALVIILYDHTVEHTADYGKHTSRFFDAGNFVIDVFLKDSLSIKEYLAQKQRKPIMQRMGRNHVGIRPLLIIPFRRFARVISINFYLIALCIRVYVFVFGLMQKFSGRYVWIYNPEHTNMAIAFGGSYRVIYDCVDYHGDEPYFTQEKRLVSLSYVTVVNSHSLRLALSQYKKDIPVVPLGFDEQAFMSDGSSTSNATMMHSPIIGYVGGINSRLDFPLLHTVIQKHANVKFIFIGPIQMRESKDVFESKIQPDIRKILALPNVRHIPGIPRSIVSKHIRTFSLCIIPYDISHKFNRLSFPMKLLEYLYMGKPVLATAIDELFRLSSYVSIGRSADDWSRHISELLHAPSSPKKIRQQRKFILSQTWDCKMKAIIRLIEAQRKKERNTGYKR